MFPYLSKGKEKSLLLGISLCNWHHTTFISHLQCQGEQGIQGFDGPSGGTLPRTIQENIGSGASYISPTHSTNYVNYIALISSNSFTGCRYYARSPPANTLRGQWWVFQNTNLNNTTLYSIFFYASTGTVEQNFKVNNVTVTSIQVTVGQTLQLWWSGTMMIGFKV